MADTPRVTVPVEDLAGKLKAIRDKFLMPTPDKDFIDYAVMTRCIDALSAAPAPEGGAVSKACADFQEAIDDFEADVADVMAEGSERADLWDREIMVNIDALKIVMTAALATREEAPAFDLIEATVSKADGSNPRKVYVDRVEGRIYEIAPAEAGERAGLAAELDRLADCEGGMRGGSERAAETMRQAAKCLRAQPPALPSISLDGPNLPDEHRVWLARQLLDSKLTDEQAYGIVRHSPAVKPPAREDAQAVAWSFELATVRDRETGEYSSWSGPRLSFTKPFVPEGSIRNLTALGPIAHPAPDALRVAVEALVPFDKALRRYDYFDGQDLEVAEVSVGDLRSASIALAALQAEQGAK